MPPRASRSPRLGRAARFVAIASVVLVAGGCAGARDGDASNADDGTEDAELVLSNLTLDVPVLTSFPSRPRDEANALGARDAEIDAWNLHFIRTADGFEGLLAYGAQSDGQSRYFMAFDAKTRSVLMIDGVQGAASSAAAAAARNGKDGASAFAARAFDEVTVVWLRSEMDRMLTAIEGQLDTMGEGLRTESLSARDVCALRLAIYAASWVVPYTKIPLIGRAGSTTAQYVGSFLIDAVGDAAIDQLTDAAKSAAGAAAAGTAMESVLRKSNWLLKRLGASAAAHTASFIVGAVLGTDGEIVLLPGDTVQKESDGSTAVRHADGSRTVIPSTGVARVLPAACRQALGDYEAGR